MQRHSCQAVYLMWVLFFSAVAVAETPRFVEVAGHELGERITVHHEMVRYLMELSVTSPRVVVFDQGISWEGRELIAAIVTSPENHKRLNEIQEAAQRFADPRRTSMAEAKSQAAHLPVIIWMGGSIHGFELSGAEGLLKLLEHLSLREDAETMEVLQQAVIIIDPMLNPDGRDAFAHLNHQNIGKKPNPLRLDWSNDFVGWQALKFRTGHYYFDTNRDWFAHTQRETRARVPTLVAWRPQVVIDAHEMGPNVEFYFDPADKPYGPYFPDFAFRWFKRFGAAYADAFDKAGFEYMTRERYNYFFPGYTTSYGSYQGAVGMLYEQGSSRGLALTRADETVRTLADALEHHYLAAWTAVRTAVANREELLVDYHASHQKEIEEGGKGTRRYLLPPGGDPQHRAALVNLLMRNGIEVDQLEQDVQLAKVTDRTGASVGSRAFPAGTYVIEAAQPRNRLVRVLLEPEAPLPPDFLKIARARVERDENPRFYDITAWSLPLLFNLEGFGSADGRGLPTKRLEGFVTSTPPPARGRASYAYLVDGGQAASLSALYHLRENGYRADITLKPTRLEGRSWSSGTVVARVGQNEDSLHDFVAELAERYELAIRPVGTGLPEEGFIPLGSGEVIRVKKPEIAMIAEHPVHAYSFGWAWYTLDQQYDIPITVIRGQSLANARLDKFNVIVIPDLFSEDGFAKRIGEGGVARLKRWIGDGGCLVTLGASVEFARKHLKNIKLRSWYEEQKKKKRKGDKTKEGEEEEEPYRFRVPGAIFRAVLDPEDWLSAGYAGDLPVLVNSNRVYMDPKGPVNARRRVVAHYAREGAIKLSGHAWPESLKRLPGTVFAYEERVGRGRVIAFAEDPNFRAFWRGANRLFLNAVILGPSAP